MPDSKDYFKYLMKVHENLMSYESREFFTSVLRSVSLQLFLLSQEQPAFLWSLLQEIRQSCHVPDVYASQSPTSPAQLEILLKYVAEHFSHVELKEVLQKPINAFIDLLYTHRSIADDFYAPMRVIQALFSVPKIRAVLLSHNRWLPGVDGLAMGETILGVILSVSSANQMNLKFEIPKNRSIPENGPLARYSTSFDNIRFYQSRTELAQSAMTRIIDYLVQEEGGWKHFLDWLSKSILSTNFKPNSMGYDLQSIQSRDLQLMEGLYLNIMLVLLHLTNKYFSASQQPMASLLKGLNMTFFETNQFEFVFSDTTPLLSFAEAPEVDFCEEISESSINENEASTAFKSIFLASIHYLQYGYMPVLQRYKSLEEQYAEGLRQDLALHNQRGSTPQGAQLQQQLLMMSFKLASLRLNTAPLEASTLKFFETISLWLATLGFGSSPKRYHPSMKIFPAFLVDSMVNYMQTVIRNLRPLPLLPKSSQYHVPGPIIKCICDVFACAEVTNYHIVSRCITVLNGIYTLKDQNGALLLSTPDSHSEISQLVLPIIQYYIKAEKTGSRMAYFEKFPVREQLGALLALPAAKNQIIRLCTDQDLFKPFITVLLNDNLFLLDEALLKLSRLQDLRTEISSLQSNTRPSPSDIRAIQEAMASVRETTQTLQSLSDFGGRFFALLETITALSLDSIVISAKKLLKHGQSSHSSLEATSSDSKDSSNNLTFVPSPTILDAQLLDQLSVMLNYFLVHFASPAKRQRFFGEGKEKFFDADKMIANLLLIYLNIHQSCLLMSALRCDLDRHSEDEEQEAEIFLKSLIRDERSYKLSIFEDALQQATSSTIFFAPTSLASMRLEWRRGEERGEKMRFLGDALQKSLPSLAPEEVAPFVVGKLRQFIASLKKCEEKVREQEIPESELPEHFLDALLATLMKDPVKLPSGNIVDRSTIMRQLEGHDKCDPFTRLPLSIDQVVPHTELQQEIQTWLASKRQAMAEARQAEASKPQEKEKEKDLD
jgi:hypothetical protein